jgi:hypothetical protein
MTTPTITRHGDGSYTVVHDGITYRIMYSQTLGWTIYTGPQLDIVQTNNGFATNYQSAEDAVEDLTGVRP